MNLIKITSAGAYCHNSQFKDVERRSNYELYLKMKNIKGYKDCKRITYKHRSRLLGESERKMSEECRVGLNTTHRRGCK